jgi:hypothetical protein
MDECQDFKIEIIEQGWLEGSLPEEGLCSHGKIKLTIGGYSVPTGPEDYDISESALALLRTLDGDHTSDQPVAERLIYHGCGGILMTGCPVGINWTVRHQGGRFVFLTWLDTMEQVKPMLYTSLNSPLASLERYTAEK